MLSNIVIASVFALLAAPSTAFIRFNCATNIVEERSDPIVEPLAVSKHAHKICGGNAFNMNLNMTYDDTQTSSCSSCTVKRDFSNYWTPKLYYHAQNGSFISVPTMGDSSSDLNGGMTLYYLQRGPDIHNLKAFPEGFRMLAGNPSKRSFTENSFAADAVSFACLGQDKAQTNGLPNYNCPDGLRAQVFFPSCWDGVNLDSTDHKSHMSYPASQSFDNGPCPASHPVQLISLFFEILYDTDKFANDWYGDKQPFVFANGDDTGYGFHGDFINGWDVDLLQRITDECNDLAAMGSTEACPPIEQYTTEEQMQCKVAAQVDESVRGVLPKLPGCNPVQSGPDDAKTASCADASPTEVEGDGTYQSVTEVGGGESETEIQSDDNILSGTFSDMTKHGWSYIGCASDSNDPRTFNDKTTMYSSGVGETMTVQKCLEFCDEYTYAGLEYGTQCHCGNSLLSSAAPKAGVMGNCDMKCEGDDNQICGGSWALSAYKVCSSGSGCTNSPPSPRLGGKRSFESAEEKMRKLRKRGA